MEKESNPSGPAARRRRSPGRGARVGPGSGGLTREVRVARKAALAAGAVLLRYWKQHSYKIGSKGFDNPVTSADLHADRVLREMLSQEFPDYGWLSEETADDGTRLRHKRVWIVDPLDGTKEFIAGIPEFVVAIALVDDGWPILGVTYNPVTREMFWAARSMGCHLNRRRVRVTRTRVLRRATMLASRSETARGDWDLFRGSLRPHPTGSVAYKLALVSAGKADGTFSRSPKSEWDIAAGAALVSEAGGRMTDIDGRELRFNRRKVIRKGMIADNGLLHDALVRLTSNAGRRPDPRRHHSSR